jgi:hypothetical protein
MHTAVSRARDVSSSVTKGESAESRTPSPGQHTACACSGSRVIRLGAASLRFRSILYYNGRHRVGGRTCVVAPIIVVTLHVRV